MVECEYVFKERAALERRSFNRYMVECECIYKSRCRKAVYCFNRYMVECEFFSSASISSSAPVLIDTWWNVNGFTDTTPKTLDEF